MEYLIGLDKKEGKENGGKLPVLLCILTCLDYVKEPLTPTFFRPHFLSPSAPSICLYGYFGSSITRTQRSSVWRMRNVV